MSFGEGLAGSIAASTSKDGDLLLFGQQAGTGLAVFRWQEDQAEDGWNDQGWVECGPAMRGDLRSACSTVTGTTHIVAVEASTGDVVMRNILTEPYMDWDTDIWEVIREATDDEPATVKDLDAPPPILQEPPPKGTRVPSGNVAIFLPLPSNEMAHRFLSGSAGGKVGPWETR